MGRKAKLRSNPALVKDHAPGAPANPLQILTHDPHGAIAYAWPPYWDFEKHLADLAFDRLKELHEEVFALSLDASNMRQIRDLDLLERIFGAGTDMISHAIRSVQHLALSMENRKSLESGKDVSFATQTAAERIKKATDQFRLNNHQGDPGYQGFSEILNKRHAVEHPKKLTVFRGGSSSWDEVPLAWILSDRSLKAYERYSSWQALLVADWNKYCQAHPLEINNGILMRGVESVVSAKKPRKK